MPTLTPLWSADEILSDTHDQALGKVTSLVTFAHHYLGSEYSHLHDFDYQGDTAVVRTSPRELLEFSAHYREKPDGCILIGDALYSNDAGLFTIQVDNLFTTLGDYRFAKQVTEIALRRYLRLLEFERDRSVSCPALEQGTEKYDYHFFGGAKPQQNVQVLIAALQTANTEGHRAFSAGAMLTHNNVPVAYHPGIPFYDKTA